MCDEFWKDPAFLGHEPIIVLRVGVVEGPVPPPKLKPIDPILGMLRYRKRLADGNSLVITS